MGPGRMNRIRRRASSSVSSDGACVSVPEAELNRQTGGRCAETERTAERSRDSTGEQGTKQLQVRRARGCPEHPGGLGKGRAGWRDGAGLCAAGLEGEGDVCVCVCVSESPASCLWVTNSDRDLRADAGGTLACLTRSLDRGPNPALGPWPGQCLPTRSWWWHAGSQQEDRSGPQRGGKQEGGPAAVVGTEAGKEQKAEPQRLWGSQWGRRGCSLVNGV